MEAKCNCGKVRVTVKDDELYTRRRGHICHCFNCRRTAGSAYGLNLIIETDKVTIDGADNLNMYEDGDSLTGNIVKRYFCKTCGNPIKSETQRATDAGKVILKLGIFKNPPEPEFESFVNSRYKWLEQHNGTEQFAIALGGEKAK